MNRKKKGSHCQSPEERACLILPVSPALSAHFFKNLGIRPSGEILIDGMDEIQDIREVPGLIERVRAIVQDCF